MYCTLSVSQLLLRLSPRLRLLLCACVPATLSPRLFVCMSVCGRPGGRAPTYIPGKCLRCLLLSWIENNINTKTVTVSDFLACTKIID